MHPSLSGCHQYKHPTWVLGRIGRVLVVIGRSGYVVSWVRAIIKRGHPEDRRRLQDSKNAWQSKWIPYNGNWKFPKVILEQAVGGFCSDADGRFPPR